VPGLIPILLDQWVVRALDRISIRRVRSADPAQGPISIRPAPLEAQVPDFARILPVRLVDPGLGRDSEGGTEWDRVTSDR